MEKQHAHGYTCAHCSCNNPILKILKEDIFHQKNFDALPKTNKKTAEKPLDLMISGGTIRPMKNGSIEKVQAIGMASGHVKITGTEEEVKNYMDLNHPGYVHKILEKGQTLLPGLIEPHVHIVPSALIAGWIPLGPFTNQNLNLEYGIASVKQTINSSEYKPKHKDDWQLGFGLDPALMFKKDDPELPTIDRKVMDDMTTAHPLMILSASMHTLYLNTPALTLVFNAGKTGFCELQTYLDKTNGQLQEGLQMQPALDTIPKNQLATMLLESFTHIGDLFQTANQRGVTMLYDAGMEPKLKLLLDAYLLLHPRAVRIGAAILCDDSNVDKIEEYSPTTEYKDIYYGHVKVVSDGSNQGLTGYQSEKYQCTPTTDYGIFNFPDDTYVKDRVFQSDMQPPAEAPDKYHKLLNKVIFTKKWPLMVHANGTQAIDYAIQVYTDIISKDPITNKRHRIEHCSLITDDQLQTMSKLSVSPSFLIGHVGYWGYAFQQVIFGKEKTNLLDPCRSALQKGMRITLHSDYQVSPLGPLRMMEQAITRKMEKDPDTHVLNQAECITAEQALVAVTYDAAWQCYADQWVGSLEKDKFADFVILAADPLHMEKPFLNMREINVIETWVGGLSVYQNNK